MGFTPKMDGENNGSKPYEQMDDLGGNPPIFGNIQMKVYRSNVGWIRVKKIEYPGRSSPLATTTARPHWC